LQFEIINALYEKKDILAFIPTGGGKSLIFQLLAACETGYTIVIMPLISLIYDQIAYLKGIGI